MSVSLNLQVLDLVGSEVVANSVANLSEKVFKCEFKEPLIHQVLTAYLAAARSGTSVQKSRSEVRGSGKKPWRQKGTGRARSGAIRSPIWRGGGVTFAARTQDYSQKVNKKMYAVAMRSIFSELFRQNRLVLVEKLDIATHKTSDFVKILKTFGLGEVLIVTDSVDENLYLASRNLFKVNICDVASLDPVNLVRFEKVLITLSALRRIEEVFHG